MLVAAFTCCCITWPPAVNQHNGRPGNSAEGASAWHYTASMQCRHGRQYIHGQSPDTTCLTMSTVTIVKNDVEGDVQRRHLLAEALPNLRLPWSPSRILTLGGSWNSSCAASTSYLCSW